MYDGIPTDTINLDALRSNVTIIPQVVRFPGLSPPYPPTDPPLSLCFRFFQPELLSGTLRQNLDMFNQYDDATLNDALRAAGLFSLQRLAEENRLTLDTEIAAGGGNLSVGQRQILALARAIVRQSKLLILDEATSAIGESCWLRGTAECGRKLIILHVLPAFRLRDRRSDPDLPPHGTQERRDRHHRRAPAADDHGLRQNRTFLRFLRWQLLSTWHVNAGC